MARAWWLLMAWSLVAAAVQAGTRVTDLAGRPVELPATVDRIVLGESRYIPALAILEGEWVLSRIVGMVPDFEQTDPGGFAQYRKRFPHIVDIPRIGHASADSFSLESVIALRADLAIFSLEGHGPAARNRQLIERLERAGVTVVFVDFRQDPLRNTPRSMALLGQILGREAEAMAFNDFYRTALSAVTDRVAGIAGENRPGVFLHSRVGLHDTCCETMVHGMMGHFVVAAGGRNVAADRIPGASGVLNLEYLISDQPDIYLGTAIGSLAHPSSADRQPYVVLGAGVPPELARRSLARVTGRAGIAQLQAVRSRRAYAIWHHFYNTPLNVVAVQVLAKWFHPRVFADLDPHRTLAALYRRFQPVPLDGSYWTSLP